jgi:hypothetical protein
MDAVLKNDEGVMTRKTLVTLGYLFGGMLSEFAFYASKTKTTDLWFLPMGLMIMCQGLEQLVKDDNAAQAKVFGKIANACCILVMVGGGWWLLRQA